MKSIKFRVILKGWKVQCLRQFGKILKCVKLKDVMKLQLVLEWFCVESIVIIDINKIIRRKNVRFKDLR